MGIFKMMTIGKFWYGIAVWTLWMTTTTENTYAWGFGMKTTLTTTHRGNNRSLHHPFVFTCSRMRMVTNDNHHDKYYSQDSHHVNNNNNNMGDGGYGRRTFMESSLLLSLGIGIVGAANNVVFPEVVLAVEKDDPELMDLLEKVKQARKQLEPVPDLIAQEKWDSVRAILITPPISDCWTKSTGRRPLLQAYADIIDELDALELKEDVLSSLRFLDMAVYNNVFNPINSEGKSAVTKELRRSYYEDPTNEYTKSVIAFDKLIDLAPK